MHNVTYDFSEKVFRVYLSQDGAHLTFCYDPKPPGDFFVISRLIQLFASTVEGESCGAKGEIQEELFHTLKQLGVDV